MYVKVPLAESYVSPGKSPIVMGPSKRAMQVSQYTEPKRKPATSNYSPSRRNYTYGGLRREELEQKTS